MNNYVEHLEKKVNFLYEQVEKQKDILIVYDFIENNNKYKYILSILNIINKNIQIGNYKRAIKYYIVAERKISKMEKEMEDMKKTITKYMIYK